MAHSWYSRLYRTFRSISAFLRQDISLGTRIYLAAFITIGAVGAALFYSIIVQTQLGLITHDILDQRIEAMHTAEQLKESVVSHNNAVLKFVATKQPSELEKSRRLANDIRTNIQQMRLLTDNSVIKRRVEELNKQADIYLENIRSVIEFSKENVLPKTAGLFEAAAWARSQDSQKRELALMSTEGSRQVDQILAICDELVTLHKYQLNEARQQMDGILLKSQRTAMSVAIATVCIVLLVALALAISLMGSLKVLIDGMERFEAGDHDVQLPVNMPGEIGQLSQIFNRMSRHLKEQREKLVQETITDELTGAFNQRHFRKLLKHEFEISKQKGAPLSLIMIDTDHFKQYNDSQGHEMGNEVLKRVSQIVRDNLRDHDHLSRYGGDEFAVLLPNTPVEAGQEIAQRLVTSVSKAHFPGQSHDSPHPITLSVGGATYPTDAQSSEDLLVKADNALFEAKRRGRNQMVWTAIFEISA
jgi:diguanylate cyclase (GGDEF)-like protein